MVPNTPLATQKKNSTTSTMPMPKMLHSTRTALRPLSPFFDFFPVFFFLVPFCISVIYGFFSINSPTSEMPFSTGSRMACSISK